MNQLERRKVPHLSSGVEVADGVGFEVAFILPAEHGGDDDDNEGGHGDGGQHCRYYPQVIGGVLDHSWDEEEQTSDNLSR